ncbi:MAG: hypothetical protein AAF488_17685 [Planctomycetota bacterium]
MTSYSGEVETYAMPTIARITTSKIENTMSSFFTVASGSGMLGEPRNQDSRVTPILTKDARGVHPSRGLRSQPRSE